MLCLASVLLLLPACLRFCERWDELILILQYWIWLDDYSHIESNNPAPSARTNLCTLQLYIVWMDSNICSYQPLHFPLCEWTPTSARTNLCSYISSIRILNPTSHIWRTLHCVNGLQLYKLIPILHITLSLLTFSESILHCVNGTPVPLPVLEIFISLFILQSLHFLE